MSGEGRGRGKPEEIVRQRLIVQMTSELGFPKELISVEKRLSQIPHLQGIDLPDRRFDILVFGNNIKVGHSVYPLLLVECKAHAVTQDALNQVVGYNSYVNAFFIALAALDRVVLGWKDEATQGYRFQEGLTTYLEMIGYTKNLRG